MSVVVSGPRRIYVLLLFRERLSGGRSWDGDLVRSATPVGRPPARLALSARVQRRLGRSLFGLSFFVLALDGTQRR